MTLLDDTLARIPGPDVHARRRAHDRLEQLTMPRWALGRMMNLAEDLAATSGSCPPPVSRRTIIVMAADHGVTTEGVSAYPREVTAQMVANFSRGGAGINAFAAATGCRLVVVDIGVDADLSGLPGIVHRKMGRGTGNIAREPAMSRETARWCLEAGISLALESAADSDVLGTGDMGIGNTTASAAIGSAVTGRSPGDIAGNGTGLHEQGRQRKIAVIERALALHRPSATDGIGLLAGVGGFEIAGLAGVMLGAAASRRPVVIDGFISTAAALIAVVLSPASAGAMICSHRSAENGHAILLDHLGKQPLLDLGMRLGEGTGAALAMPLVDAAARLLSDVATFAEAGVTGKL